MLDEAVHAHAEGPAFYKRLVLRFAKLCHTMTGHFAKEKKSPFRITESPAKAFVYFSRAHANTESFTRQSIAFLSTSIPKVESVNTRVGSNKALVKDFVREVRFMSIQWNVLGRYTMQQRGTFGVGYCAELLPFST